MASQASADGHLGSVLGGWVSDWSKAEDWSADYWVGSQVFVQDFRKCFDLRFPLQLSPESSLLPAGEDLQPALTQGLPVL